jgi:hypothetical protein
MKRLLNFGSRFMAPIKTADVVMDPVMDTLGYMSAREVPTAALAR